MVGSQRFFGSDLSDRSRPVPNRSFGYSYDPIGNRLSSAEDADGTPVVTLYESNELNQYVQTSNAVSSTSFEYDADGNMTFDGRFRYSWNGENRMIRAEETFVPTNCAPTAIIYAYDEQGRMVSKNITGTNTVIRSLLWDGYNIIREMGNGLVTHNIWGLDLDGRPQGSGGIGGLLAVAQSNESHVAVFDGIGNVSDYIAMDGTISAHFEYSPFGKLLVAEEAGFPFRHATKPVSEMPDTYEYQFRTYYGGLGRWMNRDPISTVRDEKYSFVVNNPLLHYDWLGLTIEIAPDYYNLESGDEVGGVRPEKYLRLDRYGHSSWYNQSWFANKILDGFSDVIGDCATLYLETSEPMFVRKHSLWGGDAIVPRKKYVIRYKDPKPDCICNPCWEYLRRILDNQNRTITIHYLQSTDGAFTGPLRSLDNVYINPDVNVKVGEKDPGTPLIPGKIYPQEVIPFPVVLWHEAIGHAAEELTHPTEGNKRTNHDPSFVDPVIQIENMARECLRLQNKKYGGFLFWGWRTVGDRVPYYDEELGLP